MTQATGGSWTWDGRDSFGRVVADGRYTFRVWGLDRAENGSIRDLTVRVDRTIRSVTWSKPSFIAAALQTSKVSFVLARPAKVTISIYGGETVVRGIWRDRSLTAGTYAWTWNGRTSSGKLLKPGTYRAVVTAVSSIGSSTFTRTVIIKAP
jgi:flagellar hook assembly protein FlgD